MAIIGHNNTTNIINNVANNIINNVINNIPINAYVEFNCLHNEAYLAGQKSTTGVEEVHIRKIKLQALPARMASPL